MPNDYIGKSTDVKLITLYNQMKDELLVLKPPFQRNLVWNDKHRENFIETILLGLPFPEIYLCDKDTDIESRRVVQQVVDGQQRLNAIYRYVNGELSGKKIPSFDKLSEEDKKKFYNYNVVVRDLGSIDDDSIKKIFNRINSVQYALNATEIRNALYEGEYILTAKDIAGDESIYKISAFSENQLSRMKNIEFIILVMSTIEIGGYFNRDDEVENLIKINDNKYTNKHKIKEDILQSVRLISSMSFPDDSIWFRTSSLFSLLVELIKYKQERGNLPKIGKTKKALLDLENSINNNKTKSISRNKFAKYYHFTFQATASKAARIFRGAVLAEVINKINS